jgi:deoxyribonuclease IV
MLRNPTTLLFGSAGIPFSTKKSPFMTPSGIEEVQNLGLGCMELEFVRSVNIRPERAQEVEAAAKKHNVVLTCHGQYYINLNAKEKEKEDASIQRVLNAARIAWLCHGWSCTFHAAFYLDMEKQAVYDKVKANLKHIVKMLQDEGNEIWVRPETTGKPTQFGSIQEILKLSTEVEQVMPCIDFAHLHARTNGKYNTPKEFKEILSSVEKALGRKGLDNMHIHMTGIEYGEKGEKHHLNLKESDLRYQELMKVWKEFKIKGCVISESPNVEKDAVMMKEEYDALK